MIVPAFRGEFGLMVRWHVPKVYALGAGHTIEIERGCEALYPLAKEYRIVERQPDEILRGRQGRPRTDHLPTREERFVPSPHVMQHVPRFDVVICPRKRAYCEAKNWEHWERLVSDLHHRGLSVFAGGLREASFENLPCNSAWDYERPLDATIEAMRGAKLVVAADSGLPHLAMLCGAPTLLFTYRGFQAPGPVINSHGRKVTDGPFPKVKLAEYYEAANHQNAPLTTMDGWEHPSQVAEMCAHLVRDSKSFEELAA